MKNITKQQIDFIDLIVNEYGSEEYVKYLPLLDIIVIEKGDSKINCEKYALGTSGYGHMLFEMFPKIDKPQSGDIIFYFKEEKRIQHIGIYQEDGSVISKWGKGPVLKHPIDYVPSKYGKQIFFRRISQAKLEELRQSDLLVDLIP